MGLNSSIWDFAYNLKKHFVIFSVMIKWKKKETTNKWWLMTPFSFSKRELNIRWRLNLYDGDLDYVISSRIIGKVRSCQCPGEKTIYVLCPGKKDNLWLMSQEKTIYDVCPRADIHVHRRRHTIPIFPGKLQFFFVSL